jgi:hypothetical protein
MTVSNRISTQQQRGTFSELSIARNRPHRGDLRRAESGGECRASARGHTGLPSRSRGPGRQDGPALWSCRWSSPWTQGAHLGACDRSGWVTHRSRRHAALGCDRVCARSPGDGPVDTRHVPAVVHLRSRPSARLCAGRVNQKSVVIRCRSGIFRGGDRCRFHDLRGVRQAQARCRIRIHEEVRLSPDPRHARSYRRGASRPPSQGSGQHSAWRCAFHRRACRG